MNEERRKMKRNKKYKKRKKEKKKERNFIKKTIFELWSKGSQLI